jgi:hypothetical protein
MSPIIPDTVVVGDYGSGTPDSEIRLFNTLWENAKTYEDRAELFREFRGDMAVSFDYESFVGLGIGSVGKWIKGIGKVKLINSNNPKDFLKVALKRQNLKKAPNSFKEKWSEDGYDYEVRIHPADPRYDKTGSIFRVARRQQGTKPGSTQGYGWEYLGSDGKWYHSSLLKSGNDAAARLTHIQLK